LQFIGVGMRFLDLQAQRQIAFRLQIRRHNLTEALRRRERNKACHNDHDVLRKRTSLEWTYDGIWGYAPY
jgi:hypothetical protein